MLSQTIFNRRYSFAFCFLLYYLLLFVSPVSPLPKAPDTGTPTGNSTPGTTRPTAACPETAKPLTAIAANNGQDFTASARPTFWFYIPYRAEQLSQIEFLLLNETERETIYQTPVALTTQPGVIKVELPTALAIDRNYHWRLNLDCQGDRTLEPDLTVDGWIRRVSSPSPGQVLWSDAIDRAANQYFTQMDAKTAQTWEELLSTLKLPWVWQEPLGR